MNISLPDALKAYVDEQVAGRDFGTNSEYVREFIEGVAKAPCPPGERSGREGRRVKIGAFARIRIDNACAACSSMVSAPDPRLRPTRPISMLCVAGLAKSD